MKIILILLTLLALLLAGVAYAAISVPLSITVVPFSSVLLNGGTTGLFPTPAAALTTGTTEAGTLSVTGASGVTYALSTAAPCNTTVGADNGLFSVVPTPPGANLVPPTATATGFSLNPAVGTGNGTYHVSVLASGSFTGSPQCGAFTVTGITPTYPFSDGSTALAPNGVIHTYWNNQINPASSGLSVVAIPQEWKFTGTLQNCGYPVVLNGATTTFLADKIVVYNGIVYMHSSCSSFGGPWWQYNQANGQAIALGNNAPSETGGPLPAANVASIDAEPRTFMVGAGNAGAEIALLTAAPASGSGVLQPQFSLCTNCSDDTSLFKLSAVSDTDLQINASDITAARDYTITFSDNEVTPAVTQSITLHGVANTGTANCPSVAPPAAQRAGLTTLAECEDFSQPKYATLSNWMYCSYMNNNITPFEWTTGNGTQCTTNNFFQDTDPVTGKTVLHVHSAGGAGRIQLTTIAGVSGLGPPANSGDGFDYPAANYVEWVGRNTIATVGTGSEPSPDWYFWVSCPITSPHARWCGSSTDDWWQGWGPVEVDHFENYGLQDGGAGAVHTVWSPVCGNQIPGGVTCPYWAQDAELLHINSATGYRQTIPGWTFQGLFNYGSLTTWSGDMTNPAMQVCQYLDSQQLKNNIGENCFYRSYLRNNGFLYADQNQMVNRRSLNWWVGGYPTAQDDYVQAIRVWSCANWQTDPTCVGNGITQ